MSGEIKPFVRPEDNASEPPESHTLRMLHLHVGLVGLLLFLAMLVLAGSLYADFDNVTLTRRLGLEHIRGIYEVDIQRKLLLVVALGAVSLVMQRAAWLITTRRRGALIWGRGAALLLLAGIPLGIMLWQTATRLDEYTNTIAEFLADFPIVIYGLAVVLVAQALLAVWYQITLFLRRTRRALGAEAQASAWGRRALVWGGVAWFAIVVMVGLLLGVLTNWVYELSAAEAGPGDILYATGFDGFDDDWTLAQGRDEVQMQVVTSLELTAENPTASAVDGRALVITHASPIGGGIVWSELDRVYRDFDVQATMQQVSGAYDQNQFGIIFRYRDERNFYIFRITSDGWYKLAKVVDGVEDIISDWGQSDAIRVSTGDPNRPDTMQHRANRLRVVAQDDHFRFFVNDVALPLCLRGESNVSMWLDTECYTAEPTLVWTDDEFRQGKIALAAGTLDGGPVTVAFDDVIIVGPAENINDDIAANMEN